MGKQEYVYVFQAGKHKGELLHEVFLKDPIFIAGLYQNSFSDKFAIKNKNKLQLAMENLLQKIKEIDATRECPYCRRRKVEYFLFPDFGSIDNNFCCSNEVCREELKSARSGDLHLISDFMLLISFVPKQQAQKIFSIFKRTHKHYAEVFN